MAAGKFCTTCQHGYRGSFAVHASTAGHRARLNPKRGRRRDLEAALGIRRANIRRAIAGSSGEDHEKVRAHRRRRPLDGPRHDVHVRRYWRGKSFRWRPGGVAWRPGR